MIEGITLSSRRELLNALAEGIDHGKFALAAEGERVRAGDLLGS